MPSLELSQSLGSASGLREAELGAWFAFLKKQSRVVVGGSQVGSENQFVGTFDGFLHELTERIERAFSADRNHHPAAPGSGEWLEVGRSPIRVSIVLCGVNAVVQAENRVAVRLGVAGGAASDRSACSRYVLHDDGVGREVVFANRLLENTHEDVAASPCREGYDHGDRFFGKLPHRGQAKQKACPANKGKPDHKASFRRKGVEHHLTHNLDSVPLEASTFARINLSILSKNDRQNVIKSSILYIDYYVYRP